MVKLYHLTDIGSALTALTVGSLESRADEIMRLATERFGSHAKGEEIREINFGQHKYNRFGEWFRENHIQFQTDFIPSKFPCWHNEGMDNQLVLFHFETEGYIGAKEFDFPIEDESFKIRTVLSKDKLDEFPEKYIQPERVWIPTLSLEDCTSISGMSESLPKLIPSVSTSDKDYVSRIPVELFYRKDREWYEFPL